MTLAQDNIPYPSETPYLGFIRANFLPLFPRLVDQNQFNRRARNLRLFLKELRRAWSMQKGWHDQHCISLETIPIPVVVYKRDKRHSDFLGAAAFGKCACRYMECLCYQLVAVITLFGIPIFYDLVPSNTDEHLAAEAVLNHISLCDIFSDKGFIAVRWQSEAFDRSSNLIWTPRRSNQKFQNTPAFDRFLSSNRERFEGVFLEIQDVGRNIEPLLSKTILGLMTSVIAKVTSVVLHHILMVDFGVNVQTFEVSSPS